MTDAFAIHAWTISVGILVNVSCGILGCYLVLRRLSLLGDAISHGVLPGIALAFLLTGRISGVPIILGAMVLGLFTAWLSQALTRVGNINEDSSLGVVFTALFALGVILINVGARQVDLDPNCVLYGLIEGVALDTESWGGWEIPRAVPSLALALVVTVAFVGCFWKELKVSTFDPGLATAMGFSAGLMHYLLLAVVAGVTVAAFEAVGSILVIAMLIVPAATAQMLTDRLATMLLLAAVVGAVAAVAGYAGAVWLNTSVAGMMAVAAGGCFTLAVLFGPRHGLVSRLWHTLRLALRIAAEDVLLRLYRQEEVAAGRVVETAVPSPPPATWAARLAGPWLRSRGWVVRGSAGHLQLTPPGREQAASLLRAHRLWEAYLVQNVALPLDHLHAAAERMEHFVGPALQAELSEQLGQPRVDPMGKDIPGGP